MPKEFSASVKVAYHKDYNDPVPDRLPSKKAIHDYLIKKKWVTRLAELIACPVNECKVSNAKLNEQLNLTFTITYSSDTDYFGRPVTAEKIREEMKDPIGIERCPGLENPEPCIIPTADGKRILAFAEVKSVKVTAKRSSSPKRKTTTPKRKTSSKKSSAPKRKTSSKKSSAPKRKTSRKSSSGKSCPSDKIRNPATGRCVKRSGAIGKKILSGKL